MNCPSRVDPEALPNGWNQSPGTFTLDTNNDFNGRVNLTPQRNHIIPLEQPQQDRLDQDSHIQKPPNVKDVNHQSAENTSTSKRIPQPPTSTGTSCSEEHVPALGFTSQLRASLLRPLKIITKYAKFIGPGFMVAVAYIDPGNYATDVAAGASYRFKLLVMILVSNIIAIFLQSLCIKLGSVTGLNLAENIKRHCPPWLNYTLWFFAESAIIATDIAEVMGTAIALNLLIHVPLVGGCAISIVDVLIILIFYQPSGSMRALRLFEFFVILLVIGVVVCFCVQLSLIHVRDIGQIFRGYLPSSVLVQSQGLYQACGILGATVMPHSLYLGSGIVQPRLKEYDMSRGNILPSPPQGQPRSSVSSDRSTNSDSMSDSDNETSDETNSQPMYRPSLAAIHSCMRYSIIELALSLATFALFVNSAILIVAGATLADTPGAEDADLFSIHALFSQTLAPFAGTVFALALLLSGTSAGIVCTIAGQMVSEGQLGWSAKPWVRRLVVRSISITPSIIVAGAVGQSGVSAALEGTQVALSVILPFTSAPLVWFTCRARYMGVEDPNSIDGSDRKNFRNGWVVSCIAVLVWLLIVVMNVAALVLVGQGKG